MTRKRRSRGRVGMRGEVTWHDRVKALAGDKREGGRGGGGGGGLV